PVEYVRVCDAFGTGYFYIPGTETCLKIGGYVRAQVDWNSEHDNAHGGPTDSDWNARTRGYLSIEAKNDSEIGTIGSYFAFKSWGNGDYSNSSFELDEAYITVGGFKVGYMYNYWDAGLSGETDDLGSNLINAIGYEYAADAFKVGVFVDELTDTYTDWNPSFNSYYNGTDNVGVEAMVSATFGPVTGTLLGGYDFAAENGAVRGIIEAEIGPGTLGLAAIYSSGVNAYYDVAEWTVAAEYAAKLTDKLTLTPGAQYWWNYGHADASGDFTGSVDAWKAGVTLDYALAAGLKTKVSVQYFDTDEAGQEGAWEGFVRLQRSF
ncbi:MAG: hypothetical protein DI528_22260, partial [Shinella sp.]